MRALPPGSVAGGCLRFSSPVRYATLDGAEPTAFLCADGHRIAVTDLDGRPRLLDAADGSTLSRLPGRVLAATSELLICLDPTGPASVAVLDAGSGGLRAHLGDDRADAVIAAAVADGVLVVDASGRSTAWDLETGRALAGWRRLLPSPPTIRAWHADAN